MKKLLIISTVFLISACSSIQQINDYGEYAPVNAKSNPVYQVSYLAAGLSLIQENRRKGAYKEMYEKCNGKYEMLNESEKSTGATAYNFANGITSINTSNKVYFTFKCVK
jgi:hypothetical protein